MSGPSSPVSRPGDLEKVVNWPTVTLGLSVLGLSCVLLGTYVVGPMLRPHAQTAPAVSPASYAPAAPTVTPPQPIIPPGQNSVHVTERAPAPEAPPKPSAEADTITPEITPAPEIPAPATPAVFPTTEAPPAEAPKSPSAPAPESDTAVPAPINLAPPPPASLHDPAPAAEPPARYYRVQVGRFASRSDAEALRSELGSQGYAPTVVTVRRDGREEFRVQVNTYRLRENATKTIEELKQKQYAPYVAEDNP